MNTRNDLPAGARTDGNGNGYGYTPGMAGSTAAGTTTPSWDGEGQGVGSLLRQLGHEVPELMIKELALARAEFTESLRETKAGMVSMVGGGAVLLSGLVVLLMAGVYALSLVMAPWLAALIVGAAVVLVGLSMVMAGKKRLDPAGMRPDRAMQQMHKDRMAVKAGMHSGRIQ